MNLSLFVLLIPAVIGTKEWKNVFVPSTQQSQTIAGVSAQCANDTATWQNSLHIVSEVSVECLIEKKCTAEEAQKIKENFYALEQLDAWGKIPSSGLFEIPLIFDGSYQECQRISGEKYETNYCYMILLPGKNATCNLINGVPSTIFFRSAVCMPNSCTSSDLPTVYNQISSMPFTACSAFCSRFAVEKTSSWWAFSAFLLVVVCFALLATSVDYVREAIGMKERNENWMLKILLTLSLWTNAELLLSVREHKPGFIKSLDCIRFLSMLWVVTGHTFTYMLFPDQILTVTGFFKHFWNHLLLNAFLSVDTFFLLSGIVVSYLFFKTRLTVNQIKSPVTWILFYVHRYLRLTPPIMIFIGFFTVYGYYIQGPSAAAQMNQLIPQVNACQQYWWRNLIYINNLLPNEEQCYGITWYLGVDTQLYVIAPFVLIALYFSFAAGVALITAGCVGSIITVYVLYGINDLPADFFGNGVNTNFYDIIYDKPWIRCPPYLVGLLVGYCLATYGKRKVRLNWALAVTGWIIAFGIAAACIFATYDYDKGSHWSVFTRATFYNFSRLGWAIAVSWVIVANHMGWGGPIDAFMSHPMWQPFGRLSYCAYIVHFFILYCYLNINDTSIHYYSTFQIFIYYAVPATLLSYIFAFFWSCLFEVPVLKLEKMMIESILSNGKSSGKEGDVEKQKRSDIKTEEQLWDTSASTSTKF
ncbi:unnamed protein product [Caenorhabditis sp. 36 PRJEB53466]|nr:unnamed protein product [Caenorhabditis sp. 36 PRJEB53466]